MSAHPLIVFDVNETLLDLGTLGPIFERIFGERPGDAPMVRHLHHVFGSTHRILRDVIKREAHSSLALTF